MSKGAIRFVNYGTRLAIGANPIRPSCERCGAETMFAGRECHPLKGLPWELQTFTCLVCSSVTTRATCGQDHAVGEAASVNAMPDAWAHSYGAHTAVLNGQKFRIVGYETGSQLAGRFACYHDGGYAGTVGSLANAKASCDTLSRAAQRSNLKIPLEC